MAEVSVLGIGVATMDIYIGKRRMYPGGNEYNVAFNAKLQGARAGFLGVFADDPAGEILEKTLQEGGVETAHSHHEHGCSGYSLVILTDDGDRVFLDWNHEGVTDLYPITFTDEEMDYVKTYDVVSLGRCASVSAERIRKLAEAGVDICYDFHAAFTGDTIRKFAPLTKYAFFSSSHLTVEETKATLKQAVELGCSVAVGTRGCEPVYAYDGENFYEHEVKPVKATDALGAGDSYIGAFLTHYIRLTKEGADKENCMREALRLAAEHAAHVVTIEGSVGVGYDVDPDNLASVLNI